MLRFNTKNKLNQHMVGHNNLRKWKCKTCGMSFNFKKLLQMHTRVKRSLFGYHSAIIIFVFYFITGCPWKREIIWMFILREEILQKIRSHGNFFSATAVLEIQFLIIFFYQVHVRLHTGDFPYACPVIDCDAKYPAWSNLFKHCQSRHKLDIRSEGYKKLRASEKAVNNDGFGSE